MFEDLVALAYGVLQELCGSWPHQVRLQDRARAAVFREIVDVHEKVMWHGERVTMASDRPAGVWFLTAALGYFLAEDRRWQTSRSVGEWAISLWQTYRQQQSDLAACLPAAEQLIGTFLENHREQLVGDLDGVSAIVGCLLLRGSALFCIDGPDWAVRQEQAMECYDDACALLERWLPDAPRLALDVYCARADLRQCWLLGNRREQLSLADADYERAIKAIRGLPEIERAACQSKLWARRAEAWLAAANRLTFDESDIVRGSAVAGGVRELVDDCLRSGFKYLETATSLGYSLLEIDSHLATAYAVRAWYVSRYGKGGEAKRRKNAVADVKRSITLMGQYLDACRAAGMNYQVAEAQQDIGALHNFLFDLNPQRRVPDSAVVALDEAARVFDQPGVTHKRVRALHNLGNAHRNRDEWDQAYRELLSASRLIEDRLRSADYPIVDHRRLAYLNRQADVTEKLILAAVQIRKVDEALEWCERSSARELSDLSALRDTLDAVVGEAKSNEIIRRFIDYHENSHTIQEATFLRLSDEERQRIGQPLQRPETQALPAGRMEPVDSVGVAREVGAAILYLVPSRWGTTAVIALPDGRVDGRVFSTNRDRIATIIRTWQAAYHRCKELELEWDGDLESMLLHIDPLWKEMCGWLKTIYPSRSRTEDVPPTLFVVARRGLTLVPLHAAYRVDEQTEEVVFADDEYLISFVPSASQLRRCIGSPAPALNGLLMQVVDSHGKLDGAIGEANRVRRMFAPHVCRVLSREQLLREWPRCPYSHLATHACHDLQAPWLRTAITLPSGEQLRVADLLRLRLRGVVVFSGCETAAGDLCDAENVNLSSAALNAGARSVVGTLWCADDESASGLITDFVRNLRSDLGQARVALWRARRSFRENAKDPEDRGRWAVFTSYGM